MAWRQEPNIYRSIRINFVVALWLTVALGTVLLLSMHPATYLASRPGTRAPTGLVLLVALEVAMWFYAYRNDEGYVAAAATGVVLLQPALAATLIPEVSDQPVDVSVLIASLYLALSHFAYALAN